MILIYIGENLKNKGGCAAMKYFKYSEFSCPCCGMNDMDSFFLSRLDVARDLADPIPFVITSGFRCPKHNNKVGGSDTSSHLLGFAVDIKTKSFNRRFKIVGSLICAGFTRIGITKEFVHVDDDKTKDQNVIWTY